MKRWVNKTQAKKLLQRIRREAKLETFAVEFLKRTTGKRRRMTCQFGVKRGLTGEGMAFRPGYLHLMPVWDTRKKAYRMLSLERLIAVTFRRVTYFVRGKGVGRAMSAF